ncbi:hypothetical protein J3A64_003550 [Pseudarthrobacter sp. PvP004]|nr:hypothetical protein [Pseudarthrobacter sp. PvP004]
MESTAGVQAVRRVAMTASHARRRAGAPVMVKFSAEGRRDGRLIRYPLLHLQPPHAPPKRQRRTHSRQTHQRLRVQTAESGAAK